MRKTGSHDIIILLNNDFSFDRRMLRIARSLKSAGLTLLVISIRKSKFASSSIEEFPVIYIQCRFNKGPLFYLESNIRMLDAIRKFSFRAVSCVDLDTVLPGILGTAFKKNIRRYFDSHEWFEEVPELQGRSLKRWIWRRLACWLVPKFDVRYTVSSTLAKQLRLCYGVPFEIIRNLPDAAGFRRSPLPIGSPVRLVYLGAINPGRGLDLAIECLIGRQGFCLDIYGSGPEQEKLESMTPVDSNIRFMGYLEGDQIASTLCQYDLGLLLLDSNSLSYRYSLANKVFDYLHAGLPVIVMSFPEYCSLNVECPAFYFINDYNTDELNNCLNLIETRKEVYQEKQKRAIEARDLWNWKKEEKLLHRIYAKELKKDQSNKLL